MQIHFTKRGDYWECFGNDALIVARVLGLVVTHRDGIKECGIPDYVFTAWSAKLREAGYEVST